MKAIGLCAVLLLAVCTLALARAAAVAPAIKQFTTAFVLTSMKDGKRIELARPNLLTNDGQEGAFVSGGEVPVDADAKDVLSFGIKAQIKVRELAPDKLRVLMYAGHSELDAQGDSNFSIREQGVRCVRTVKPGEKIEIDLDEGRHVAVTVNPVVVNR